MYLLKCCLLYSLLQKCFLNLIKIIRYLSLYWVASPLIFKLAVSQYYNSEEALLTFMSYLISNFYYNSQFVNKSPLISVNWCINFYLMYMLHIWYMIPTSMKWFSFMILLLFCLLWCLVPTSKICKYIVMLKLNRLGIIIVKRRNHILK